MNQPPLFGPRSPQADVPCTLSSSPPQGLDRPEFARFLCLVVAVGFAFAPLVAVVRRCVESLPEAVQAVAQLFRTVV